MKLKQELSVMCHRLSQGIDVVSHNVEVLLWVYYQSHSVALFDLLNVHGSAITLTAPRVEAHKADHCYQTVDPCIDVDATSKL